MIAVDLYADCTFKQSVVKHAKLLLLVWWAAFGIKQVDPILGRSVWAARVGLVFLGVVGRIL